MKLIVTKNLGFCWGVKRAIELAENFVTKEKKNIYTYGPLIHNQNVVKMLKKKGVLPYHNKILPDSVIIIRAHGVPPKIQIKLKHRGFKIIDATCPHVQISEKRTKESASKGFKVIIVGDKKHAEVRSLVGYARSGNRKANPLVISSIKEADCLKVQSNDKITLVAQSTFQKEEYQKISQLLSQKISNIKILDTICKETTRRHYEVKEMSSKIDALLVIGAHSSANTSRLANLGKSLKVATFHISSSEEIPLKKLQKYKTIGIVTGTSTPKWLAENIIKTLSL